MTLLELTAKQSKEIGDLKDRLEKYETPGLKCNGGHTNHLPLKLWTCPMCDDERLKTIEALKAEALDLKITLDDWKGKAKRQEKEIDQLNQKLMEAGGYCNELKAEILRRQGLTEAANEKLKDTEERLTRINTWGNDMRNLACARGREIEHLNYRISTNKNWGNPL